MKKCIRIDKSTIMLSKKVRIAFINYNSPLDRKASSGTTFQMCQA